MTPQEEEIFKLAQSIELARNNRYSEVDDDERTTFIDQTIDWVNQLGEELEREADWNYLRQPMALIGVVPAAGKVTMPLPTEVRKLTVSEYRDLVIMQDGTPVSRFTVVSPDKLTDPDSYGYDSESQVTVVGRTLVFSRELTEAEVGGDVLADVLRYMPKLSRADTALLSLVEPMQLIVLGVAKNSTLPDIVQGGISPSLVQRYNSLLKQAVAENNATAGAPDILGEDFGFIRGVFG